MLLVLEVAPPPATSPPSTNWGGPHLCDLRIIELLEVLDLAPLRQQGLEILEEVVDENFARLFVAEVHAVGVHPSHEGYGLGGLGEGGWEEDG